MGPGCNQTEESPSALIADHGESRAISIARARRPENHSTRKDGGVLEGVIG